MDNIKVTVKFGSDTTKEGVHEVTVDIPPSPKFPVGMLRRNNNDLNLNPYTTANLMAYMAKQFDIELYFFTPKDFNPQDKTINAVLIEGNVQTPKTVPLPKIVYDVNDLYYNKEIRELLKDDTYFFQYGWGASKRVISDILIKDGRFKEYLIPSHAIENFEHFLSLFKQYNNDVVLKPNAGSLGKGVVRITANQSKEINIILQNEKISLSSVAELQDYYEKHFTTTLHVLNPYIISRTKYGTPFDIRVHVRRGSEGNFNVVPYPRIGRDPEKILSNINAGGHTMPITKFLKQEYSNDWKMIYDKLMYLGNSIPDVLQAYSTRTIFAMGIDVGIEQRGNSYEFKLFEVNTYNPGISSIPIEAAFITLEYMKYLGKRLSEEKPLDKV